MKRFYLFPKMFYVLFLTTIFVFENGFSQRRGYGNYSRQKSHLPNFTVGVGAGYFFSSIKNFDQIYGTSGGFTYGLDASIKFSQLNNGGIYGVIQYYWFRRTGEAIGDIEDVETKLEENILNIGSRYCWSTQNSNVRLWVGGGISIIKIKEEFILYGEKIPISEDQTGFYLEFGDAVILSANSEFFINLKWDYAVINKDFSGVAGDNPNVGGITIFGGYKFSSF